MTVERSGRRRRGWWLAALALILLVGVATWRLGSVARDLQQAEDLIDEASVALTDGRLADARAALGRAEGLVLAANQSLRGSVAVDAVALIPGIRQNVDAIEESIALAATVVHGGVRILEVSVPLQSDEGTLEVSLSDGSIPLDAVSAAGAQIEALRTQLVPALAEDGPGLLLPPVRELREEVHDEATARGAQLGVLGRGLELLREMAGADGPRRYLLAVANTAEMRGSGGMILNYGVLEGLDGTIDLTAFGRIDELALAAPVPIEVAPADYLDRWAGFEPLTRWRQANLAGDFTVVAPVLEAMYEEATQLPVNGVIQIDAHGLAAVLEGVGPVSVAPLGEVRSDNVVDLTLNEAYVRFPEVDERTEVLGDVAEAAFRRLVDGEIPSLRGLATALAEAVEGRHLLMHTTTPSVQRALVAFGADGAYPPLDTHDAIALTVQNLAGNKLDYYLDTALRVTGTLPDGEVGEVTAEVVLTNTAPAGATEPRYVFGPGATAADLPAGTLRSVVTLYLPLGASLEGASGDELVEPAVGGAEAGRPYASFTVDVPAGQSRTVALAVRTAPRPEGPISLTAVPSPRVRPTTLEVDVDTTAGPVRGSVELDRTWALVSGRSPVEVRAPAFR